LLKLCEGEDEKRKSKEPMDRIENTFNRTNKEPIIDFQILLRNALNYKMNQKIK